MEPLDVNKDNGSGAVDSFFGDHVHNEEKDESTGWVVEGEKTLLLDGLTTMGVIDSSLVSIGDISESLRPLHVR